MNFLKLLKINTQQTLHQGVFSAFSSRIFSTSIVNDGEKGEATKRIHRRL